MQVVFACGGRWCNVYIAQWLRARGKNESTRVALVANAKSEVQLPFLNFVFVRKIPNVLKRKFVGLMDIAEGEID